jgi:hypothetical protein
MGFSTFTDMPRLHNYKQAYEHWKMIKPLRGSDVRPLCPTTNGRRKKHLRIEVTDEAVQCWLYRTPVVTYYSNGDIEIDNEYPSQSTNSFVSELLGNDASMCFRSGGTWLYTYAGWWLVKDGLVLRRNTKGHLEPINPHQHYIYKIDRKAIKNVRKQYAAFRAHVQNIAKLIGVGVCDIPYTGRPKSLHSIMRDESMEGWGEAVQYLLIQSSRIAYNSAEQKWGRWVYPSLIDRRIEETMKEYHAEELFYAEAVPMGQYKEDTNSKYVRGVM